MGLFGGKKNSGGTKGNKGTGKDLSQEPSGKKNYSCPYQCVNDKRQTWAINPATDEYAWIWIDCTH